MQANTRDTLIRLLRGEGAHVSVDQALDGLPRDLRGHRPAGHVHSVYDLLEHLRRAQRDILRYIEEPGYRSPPWPEGYWPEPVDRVPDEAWVTCVEGFRSDLARLVEITGDAARDLEAPLDHAPQHTLLRELLLVADHNAYHGGQIVAVRRAAGAW
jgi:uncharacterized damage-inducible protein DinB